jgi:hypothetical protein
MIKKAIIMKTRSKISIVTTLVTIFFYGCGGSSSSNTTNDAGNITPSTVDDNKDENNSSDLTDNTNHSLTYQNGNGILIESLKNGKKLIWVNSRTNICKISRPENRDSDLYSDAKDHCQMLSTQNYANISSWRLPTVEEATHLMSNVDRDKIIYPDDNPHCAHMSTATRETFVYTTSDWNTPENVGKSYHSSERNNKVAGIRCVSSE